MIMTASFHTETFQDEETKIAYKRATSWLAKNVIKQAENQDITYKIEKVKDTILPTFRVTLFCSLEMVDEENRFCSACKEYHKSFFINQEYNCDACKCKAYLARVEARIARKKSYKKEKLKYNIEHR